MSGPAITVAVVGGGQNCEHEVSLASAAAVAEALESEGYAVTRLTIAPGGDWWAQGQPMGLAGAVRVLRTCDVVFPALHGPRGEDGTIAALCELAGVPYVGAGVGAGAIAMDKWVTKLVAQAVGIATAAGRLVTSADAAAVPWDGPVVAKPVAAGSSFGVSLVEDARQLGPALAAALAYGPRALLEEVVVGREIDVAVIGLASGERRVSPPLEIVTRGLFDHATKYDGTAEFRLPAVLEDGERKGLVQAALAIYDALGCAGVSRVDFFLTETRGWVLNEVNTMPGMTEHSQVPKMFAADGLPYSALLDLLVRDTFRRDVVRSGL